MYVIDQGLISQGRILAEPGNTWDMIAGPDPEVTFIAAVPEIYSENQSGIQYQGLARIQGDSKRIRGLSSKIETEEIQQCGGQLVFLWLLPPWVTMVIGMERWACWGGLGGVLL